MHDVTSASMIIRLTIGFVMVCFSVYQMVRPAAWLHYIPKRIAAILPLKLESIMRMHSLGNLGLGLVLMSGLLQPWSLWAVLAWWLFVLPLCGRIDITDGLRDLAIISAIIALIILR